MITGDLNLDLVKMMKEKKIQSYFDLFVKQVCFTQIVLPTGVSVKENKWWKKDEQ